MRTAGIGNYKISKDPTGNLTRKLRSCDSVPTESAALFDATEARLFIRIQ